MQTWPRTRSLCVFVETLSFAHLCCSACTYDRFLLLSPAGSERREGRCCYCVRGVEGSSAKHSTMVLYGHYAANNNNNNNNDRLTTFDPGQPG